MGESATQSLVEDVNSAVVVYRNHYLAARKDQNKDMTETAVHGANALLMDQFRVRFDTMEYDRVDRVVDSVRCQCGQLTRLTPEAVRYHAVDTALERTPRVYRYVSCRCGGRVYVHNLRIVRDVIDDAENKYAPEPPRVANLIEQVCKHSQYWQWVDLVWAMIEGQHRKQREFIGERNASEEGEDADQ